MFSEIQLAQSALAASTIQRQINHCCARTASNDCSFCQRTTAKQPSPLGRRSSARLRRIRRSGCAAAKHPGKPFKRVPHRLDERNYRPAELRFRLE
jgi:hypothetical protein